MCELVCNQPAPAFCLGLELALREDNIGADGERTRVERARGSIGRIVRVHADVAERAPESRLHRRTCRRVER